MGDVSEGGNVDTMRRMESSSFGAGDAPRKPLSLDHKNKLDLPSLNTGLIRELSPPIGNFVSGFESGKRAGMPLSHLNQIPPNSCVPVSSPFIQRLGSAQGASHLRSLSQPSFFNLDSLPPMSPSPYRESSSTSVSDQVSVDVSMEERDASSKLLMPPLSYGGISSGIRVGESLPPRKAHRRSSSDIRYVYATVMQSSPPLRSSRSPNGLGRSVSNGEDLDATKPVKGDLNGNYSPEGTGERKSEEEVIDDLFSAYMNLDKVDKVNSSGNIDKNDNLTKKSKGDNSDNEEESCASESGNGMSRQRNSIESNKREGLKRSAGGDIAPKPHHSRSVSMDSFIGNMYFDDEFPKLMRPERNRPGQLSPGNSLDKNSNGFSLEFGNGEFTGAELKKIMNNDKLTEIAVTDPKRVKRILANRQSAARSKERKMRYIQELEHKVQALQAEATTLSAQLTIIQRNSGEFASQNNELKFRLRSMMQQAQLRDALNEQLSGEVQRLKLAGQDLSGESPQTKSGIPQHNEFSDVPHASSTAFCTRFSPDATTAKRRNHKAGTEWVDIFVKQERHRRSPSNASSVTIIYLNSEQ